MQNCSDCLDYSIELTADGIIITEKGIIKKVNSVFLDITDLSKAKCIGKKIQDLFELPKAYEELARNSNSPIEVSFRNKAGERRYFRLEYRETSLNGENTTFTIIKDITDYKTALEKLEEIQIQYSSVFNNATAGILLTDKEGRIIKCNDAFCEMLGYSPEEMPGINFRDITPDEDLVNEDLYIDKIFKNEIDHYNIIKRYIRKKGDFIWVHINSNVIRNSDGTIKHGVAVVQDISVLETTKQELKESELRYKTLADLTHEGIVIHKEGTIIDVNRAFLNIYGFTREELINENKIENLFSEEVISDIYKKLSLNFLGVYQSVGKRKDGSSFPVEIFVDEIFYQQKKVRVVLVRDITAQKLAEKSILHVNQILDVNVRQRTHALNAMNKKLQKEIEKHKLTHQELSEANKKIAEKEAMFQLMAKNFPNGTINLIDDNYRFLIAGGKAYEKYNYDFNSIVGKTLDDILVPHVSEEAKKYIDKARTGKNQNYDIEVSGRIYNNVIVPIEISPGVIHSFLFIVTDVTSRKKYELKLQKAKTETEQFVKQLKIENKERERIEKELRHANKEIENHRLALMHEKTELQKTMFKLKQTQQHLIQSEKMASLGILTAGVAHEINNPVNYISSGIIGLKKCYDKIITAIKKCREDYQSEGTKDEKVISGFYNIEETIQYADNMFSTIQDGVNKTVEIIESMRGYSRDTDDRFSWANINNLINGSLVMLHNRIKNHITVNKTLKDIPAVYCIPGRIHQVLINILTNSIDAINGKGMIWIASEYNKDKSGILISVRDNGQGIPSDIHNKVYDPFFTTKEVGTGTGLGLYISYKIIKEHQGVIEYDSEPGEGTEFRIELPLACSI
ncbi:MAG: PAS domain S-box protein [Bacteroidota bacterium]